VVHRHRLDGTHFALALDASLNPLADSARSPIGTLAMLPAGDLAFAGTDPLQRPRLACSMSRQRGQPVVCA
jgi:hypothetical protein